MASAPPPASIERDSIFGAVFVTPPNATWTAPPEREMTAASVDQLVVAGAAVQRRVGQHARGDLDAVVPRPGVAGDDGRDVIVLLAVAEPGHENALVPLRAAEVRDPVILRAVGGVGPAAV